MYIRKSSRTYNGKTYTNYVLVESVVTSKGPRQKTICSLGDLSPRPRQEWLKLARKIEDALVGQDDLLGRDDTEVAGIVARVRARQTNETHAEAEPLYKRALSIREKALGLDHASLGTPLNNLAELYREQGRYLERIHKWARRVGFDTIRQQIMEDGERRRALYDRFVFSQQFAQIDPWAERAQGKDAHEFAPVADLTLREAAE